MRSSFIVVAALAAFVAAQQTVQVGPSGTFTFEPSSLTAQPGDTIMFNIVDPIHTVTQGASLDTACTQAGFSSNLGDSSFQITVNSTDPIYIFCSPHCTFGMVMIINPASPDDVGTFSSIAQGGPIPSSASTSSGASAPVSSGAPSSSAPPATTGASSTPAPSQSAPPSSASSVVPSMLGAFVGLVLAAVL